MTLTEAREHIKDWADAALEAERWNAHNREVDEVLTFLPQWFAVEDGLPEMQEPYKGGPLTSKWVLTWDGSRVGRGKLAQTYGRMKKNPETGCLVPDPTTRKTRWEDSRDYVIRVTHWMPLPAPPEVQA